MGGVLSFLASTTANAQVFNTTQSTTTLKERHYYPKQIAITDFSNPLVWVVIAGCVALIVYALVNLKKKTVLSYAILFFVITFSITSNLLFNVGTFMNERFVFIPSLGFTLIIGYWLYLLAMSKSVSLQKLSVGILAVVGLLFGIKTFCSA